MQLEQLRKSATLYTIILFFFFIFRLILQASSNKKEKNRSAAAVRSHLRTESTAAPLLDLIVDDLE